MRLSTFSALRRDLEQLERTKIAKELLSILKILNSSFDF
jgi:hypothetical protein